MNDDLDDQHDTPMVLPAVLDFAAAESFLGALRQRLEMGGMARLDAAKVETLTLPCIQIILAAIRGPVPIAIENPSAAFVSAFEDLGLDWMGDKCVPSDPQRKPQQVPQQMQSEQPQDGPPQLQTSKTTDCKPDDTSPVTHEKMDEPSMNKRILTIDDSKTMRDMLMLTLADAGFDVLQAVDGQDGIDVLGKERVDVVITDINMPRMDGYEVIRQLRRSPVHKTMPILVLTTESDSDKKMLARDAGATGWMVKPFDPDRLIATVRKVAP